MAELYRKRYDGVDAITLQGGGLTNVATSITFNAALQSMGTNVATLGTDEYLPLVIDNEIVYLTAYTAAATTGTISRGKEGTTGAAHSAGANVIHGPTARDFKVTRTRAYRTSNLSVTSNSLTTVMDSSLDGTLAGEAGDRVSFTFVTYVDSNTNVAHFNVWTLPPAGGSLINKAVNEGSSFNPFYCETGFKGLFTFTDDYILQPGDITSGQFRLTITVHTANAARTLGLAVIGTHFTVINHGPISA